MSHNTPQVHGHRGSRGTHPENTLPAFEEAVEAGAEVLELDMQVTADNTVVVSHEPELTPQLCRYASGKTIERPIPIRSLTAKELAQFECGSVPNPRFPEQKRLPGTGIPTLESFLQWKSRKAPQLEMNIETKMTASDPKWIPDPTLFASLVISLLKKYGAVDKAILQSFDFRTLSAAKKLSPSLRLSCLFENETNFCELTAKTGAHFASPNLSLVTPDNVKACHAKNIQVVPWTANTEAEWNRLIDCKVDAIITDYPRKLIQFLGKRK